jgi:hypothetical protein
MATEQDDVLSLDDSDQESFSGFSTLSGDENKSTKSSKRTEKSPQKKTKSSKKHKSPSESKNGKKDKKSKEGKKSARGVDFTKMSVEDIDTLRGLLGINTHSADPCEEEKEFLAVPLSERSNLRVEIENDKFGDGDHAFVSQDLSQALFEDGEQENFVEDIWDLPRLKAPEKGDSVAKSLANMINLSCSSQCEIDHLTSKYKVPQNCTLAFPPTVNSEIWKIMDRRSQSIDKSFVEVQSLVGTAMTPIIKLAEVLKPTISGNVEAKTMLANALNLLGQIQFNLSLRRRYSIRPQLKRKYHSLCNASMPITTELFGDDVSKDIKACDSTQSIGFTPYKQSFRGRGRASMRRPYGFQGQRYQPYARGQSRPPYFQRGARRAPTATVTAPNEKI